MAKEPAANSVVTAPAIPESERPVVSSTGNRINLAELPHHDPDLLTAVDEVADNMEARIKSYQGVIARKRTEPGTDAMTVRAEMRQKYGIGAEESLSWKNNPQVTPWNQLQGNQSLDHWLASVPGARVVYHTTEDGKREPVKAGDAVLCAYDSAWDAAVERNVRAKERETFLRSVDEGLPEKGDMEIPDPMEGNYTIPRYREDAQQLSVMRTETLKELTASGMIGEYKSQPMDAVLTGLGVAKSEEIMARYRGESADARAARQNKTSVGYSKSLAENWPKAMAKAKK